MATLPNNQFFNISDTNYAGIGFGASDSMGRDIDKLTADNSAMFQMYGQQAIAMANQRSSNFQKFGSLFKEAATAKNAIEKWQDAKDLDNQYKPEKEKEEDKKPDVEIDPPEDKKEEDKKEKVSIKKDEAQLTHEALETATKSNTVDATINAINTVNVTKAPNLEEQTKLSKSAIVDQFKGYSSYRYTNKFPANLYGGQPGDPDASIEQLINNDKIAEAGALRQNLAKSFMLTAGVYDRNSPNFIGFSRRQSMLKEIKAYDDKFYNTYLTKKLSEVTADNDFKRRSVLAASFQDKSIPASQTISDYIETYVGETGVKDNPRVFRKLYEDIEYGVDKGSIKTTDLEAVIKSYTTHSATGEAIPLSEINANSKQFVSLLRGLKLKAGRQELLNREAEKANDIAIDVDNEIAKLNQVVNNPDAMPSIADRNKALLAISAKHNIPIGDKRLDKLRKSMVWEEKDDQETMIHFMNDLQKNPINTLDNLAIRLAEFNTGSARKTAKEEADRLNDLLTHSKVVKEYEGLVSSDIKGLFKQEGKSGVIHVDDMKEVTQEATEFFRDEFLKALPGATNASDAAKIALAKVKAITGVKDTTTGARIGYKDTIFYKQSLPNTIKSQIDRDLFKVLKQVNDNPVQMLNSETMWAGEDMGAAQEALNYLTGVPGATFPVYYAKIARDLKGYTSHELMLLRLDKLGMLPKDVKVNSPEKDNISNKYTLEKFLYKPTNGRTVRGLFELGENTDWYYETNHSRYAYLRSDKSDERYNSIDSGKNATSINNLQELTFPQVIAAWNMGYGHQSGLGAFGFSKAQLMSLVPDEGEEFGDLDFVNGKFDKEFQKKAFDALHDRQLFNTKMFNGLDPSINSSFNVSEDFAEAIGLDVNYFKGVNQAKYLNFDLIDLLMNEEL